MDLSSLLNPAGGLRYHFRALRYRNRQWKPFRWAIGEWLLGWQPREANLLLVGPSAGYCLQPFFFERFERIVCLEPDPVARSLFRRRLHRAPLERQPRLEFIAEDHLVRHPEKLTRLLDQLPDTCLLFSNVLGQLRALLDDENDAGPAFEPIEKTIRQSIQGRSWASFHDRISGYRHPNQEYPVTSSSRLSNQEILEEFFGLPASEQEERSVQWIDHLTEGLLPADLPHWYFPWEIEPGRIHVIEAVATPLLRGGDTPVP